MIHQIKSYLKFVRTAKNQHGVHSPFVYDLVTKCFYDTNKHPAYQILKKYRKALKSDTSTIEVTDFGAGSRVFSSTKRKVSAIAKTAGIRKKRQKLLFRLVNYFTPANALELGTSLGKATFAIATGNKKAKVISVEGCPQTAKKAEKTLEKFSAENVVLINATFEDFFQQNQITTFDFVFVDGNHSKENTLTYFKELLKRVHNESVIIFDDIYWSPSMTQAWQEIIQHPKVTVSIDTFQWGLVFFRKEQAKQHFKIRV